MFNNLIEELKNQLERDQKELDILQNNADLKEYKKKTSILVSKNALNQKKKSTVVISVLTPIFLSLIAIAWIAPIGIMSIQVIITIVSFGISLPLAVYSIDEIVIANKEVNKFKEVYPTIDLDFYDIKDLEIETDILENKLVPLVIKISELENKMKKTNQHIEKMKQYPNLETKNVNKLVGKYEEKCFDNEEEKEKWIIQNLKIKEAAVIEVGDFKLTISPYALKDMIQKGKIKAKRIRPEQE